MQTVLGSWEEINKKYNESETFGKVIAGNGFLKKTVETITAGMTSNEQKIDAIFNYVRQNVSWDETSRRSIDGSLKESP